jgi:hypothetical protein
MNSKEKRELKFLRRLVEKGEVLMNYDSTDCDGCSTSKVVTFKSWKELIETEESEAEWCDGWFSYSLPFKFPDGSLDLNESYNGGQWGE